MFMIKSYIIATTLLFSLYCILSLAWEIRICEKTNFYKKRHDISLGICGIHLIITFIILVYIN